MGFRPLPNLAPPDGPRLRPCVLEKTRGDLGRETWQNGAFGTGHVLPALEREEAQGSGIVPPDLGNAHGHVDLHLVDGGARDVDLDDEIGRWIAGELDPAFATDAPRVSDVDAGIRLESAIQIFSFQCGRSSVNEVDASLFRDGREEVIEKAVGFLVLE